MVAIAGWNLVGLYNVTMETQLNKPKVVVGLVEKEGNFLLIRRKNPSFKLEWAFPGGVTEEGETDEETVIRECEEEVGIKVVVREMLFERKHPNTLVQIAYMSCYQTDDAEAVVGQADEIAEVEWVAANEVLTRFTSDVHPKIREFVMGFERN